MNGPLYDFADEEGVPPFTAKALHDYERSLNSDRAYTKVAYDPEYVKYLKVACGRSLRNCWLRDHRGRERRIDRIFSYANREDLKGKFQPSWRGDGDVRLEYSVPYFESLMPNWQENDVIVPFAGVSVNQSAAYDMLCFHFGFIPKPVVVLWEHEENPDSDLVHFIARDFAAFAESVFAAK